MRAVFASIDRSRSPSQALRNEKAPERGRCCQFAQRHPSSKGRRVEKRAVQLWGSPMPSIRVLYLACMALHGVCVCRGEKLQSPQGIVGLRGLIRTHMRAYVRACSCMPYGPTCQTCKLPPRTIDSSATSASWVPTDAVRILGSFTFAPSYNMLGFCMTATVVLLYWRSTWGLAWPAHPQPTLSSLPEQALFVGIEEKGP
jgi:hypothetical protein